MLILCFLGGFGLQKYIILAALYSCCPVIYLFTKPPVRTILTIFGTIVCQLTLFFLLYFSFHVHEYLIHSLQLFNKTLQFFFFLQKIDLTPNSDNIQSNRMLAYLILITLFRISLFMFMNISFTSFLWTGIQMTRYGCRKNTEMRMVHRRFCEKIKQPPPLFRDCYLRECAQPM